MYRHTSSFRGIVDRHIYNFYHRINYRKYLSLFDGYKDKNVYFLYLNPFAQNIKPGSPSKPSVLRTKARKATLSSPSCKYPCKMVH